MRISLPSVKLVLAVALSSTSFLNNFTWVKAQNPVPISTPSPQPNLNSSPLPASAPIKGRVRVVLPELPPGIGPAPGGRRFGGATRGQCPTVKQPLAALVPLTKQPPSIVNVWGLTTQEYPKLWFYLPYTTNSAYPAEFTMLDDESKDPLYTSAIALPKQAGVIDVPLPTNVSALQVGKRYRWFFNIYCDPQKQSAPIYVEGVIIRTGLNQTLAKQLQKAKPIQQVAIYANNGFWHDALTKLAELRQKNPQNYYLQTEWTNLLTAIGLGELATKPLIP
ncbi:DUF928 domain-containing protein [Chlorogloeopsis sp. ULAP02]|uniref:DUF928 domain-containing protein n=1 Tax=Chlorogloeopsis sp. ULAP02 TaxID=3107926 RepID=UPI003136F119